MVGSISGVGSYFRYANDTMYRGLPRGASAQQPQSAAGAQASRSALLAPRRAASPETPVQPVAPAAPVGSKETQPVVLGPVLRQGADPAEMAVRMRIQPYREDGSSAPESARAAGESAPAPGVESAQQAAEEGRCETCEKRKYQDGSDDMGVSFQTPTRVDPDLAASAVRGHENEHVVREQAKAQREDRRVVSQSVTLHTDICPECGKAYISGGTTRTVTAAQQEEQANAQDQQERKGFSVFG